MNNFPCMCLALPPSVWGHFTKNSAKILCSPLTFITWSLDRFIVCLCTFLEEKGLLRNLNFPSFFKEGLLTSSPVLDIFSRGKEWREAIADLARYGVGRENVLHPYKVCYVSFQESWEEFIIALPGKLAVVQPFAPESIDKLTFVNRYSQFRLFYVHDTTRQ